MRNHKQKTKKFFKTKIQSSKWMIVFKVFRLKSLIWEVNSMNSGNMKQIIHQGKRIVFKIALCDNQSLQIWGKNYAQLMKSKSQVLRSNIQLGILQILEWMIDIKCLMTIFMIFKKNLRILESKQWTFQWLINKREETKINQ